LKKREQIKFFFAFCLLVLFTISVTPKIYFHDVIANHKDVVSLCHHPQKVKACLHPKSFNCQLDDLVITAPYLILPIVHSLSVHSHFQSFSSAYSSSFTKHYLIHKESRGPPLG